MGIELNFSFVSCAIFRREAFTTWADTAPFSAYFLIDPSAHPMFFSMVLAIPGAASRMEFNSSPLSAPAAIAWDSCTIALDCSCADAPPMTNCLLTCSMKAISSSFVSNAFPAFNPIFAIAPAVSIIGALALWADANIFCVSWSVDCSPSFIRFSLAVVCVTLSERAITFCTLNAAAMLIAIPFIFDSSPDAAPAPLFTDRLN